MNPAKRAVLHSASEKVIFANQLRGVAALCVVLVHYTVVYHYMRPLLAWVIAAPPIEGPIPAFATWIFPWWFDMGAFGVALFFLISGFVIPFSLERSTVGSFLLARALRIYPTYWAALLVEWTTIYAASRYWGKPVAFDWRTFLDNIALIHTAVGAGGVDFVNWTLAIEIKFYVLMALLRPLVLRSRVWPLLLYALGAVALNAAQGRGLIHLPPQLVAESRFVAFMLAGTLFHYHFARTLSAPRLMLACGAVLGLTMACWKLGPNAAEFPIKALNYVYALAAFAAAYAARSRFRRALVLDFFASISYPLYLVHALFGFSAMSFLMLAWRVPYAVAAPVAFVLAVLIAWTLHVSVERASIAAGRRVGARQARKALSLRWPEQPVHSG